MQVLQTRLVPVDPEPEQAVDSYVSPEQAAAQVLQARLVDPEQAVV